MKNHAADRVSHKIDLKAVWAIRYGHATAMPTAWELRSYRLVIVVALAERGQRIFFLCPSHMLLVSS